LFGAAALWSRRIDRLARSVANLVDIERRFSEKGGEFEGAQSLARHIDQRSED
jgi:hypothetical protein